MDFINDELKNYEDFAKQLYNREYFKQKKIQR